MKIYNTKSIKKSVKDVDLKSGVVTGYISHFGNKDLAGDIIEPTAFNKTLSDQKNKYLLFNHSWLKVAGVFDVLKADKQGLYFEKNLLKSFNVAGEKISNQQAKDLLTLYAEGAITEHSIGYRVVSEEQKSDANYLKELQLFEGSALTVQAANPLTPFLGFKSCKTEYSKFENILKQNKEIENLLKIKTLSDDFYFRLEMAHKQLSQMINDFEPNKDTQQIEPSHSNPDLKSTLINLI